MRPHRRVLHPVPGAGDDCHAYWCSTPPPAPPVPSYPDFGPVPSPAPASSPIPATPPISFPPSPSPAAHSGRRNQGGGGGMHGYGPPPPGGTGGDHRWHYLKYVLIAAGAIALVSLILLGVSVAVRHRQVRRRRRQQAALLAPATPPPPGGAAGGFDADAEIGGGGGGGVVHHVWYIRTVGLDEAAISSIAATRYRAGAGLLGAADCPVCLGEFQDGELVRLLPKCGHAFHVPCIDTWLRAHVNCPLCRSDVLDPAVTADGGGGGGGEETSSDPSPADLDPNDNVVAEQAAAASDAIPDHEQEERDHHHQEQEEASHAQEEQQEQSTPPEPPPPPPQRHLFCSLPRNVRRAASMDAAIVSTAADVAAPERLLQEAPEEEQIGGRRKRSCAKASGSGHRSNLSIDRPASGGIPRSFFSRHSRARSSVLPLSSPS